MEQDEFRILVQFFKTLADETRLRILGLLSSREYGVGELAVLLDLKEPTISHHLARLKELDLVEMRADGNNRFYRLNRQALEGMNRRLLGSEQVVLWPKETQEVTWDQKVLADYLENGRLKTIPSKQKKLLPILKWLAAKFEPGVQYTEREVNTIIGQVCDDYVSLRRELIDYHFLERESGGGLYWRVQSSDRDQ